MVDIYIDGERILKHEYPMEFIADGTEEFNVGTLKITNSSQREPFTDYDKVVIIIDNTITYQAVIQRDLSVRIAPDIYEHSMILAEPVIKLSQYIMADRYYTTINGSIITYKDQLDNILLTHNFGKSSPFTIHADTQTLLNVDAPEKEYSGGDLLTTLTDMFRSVNAIPTLDIYNVIGHRAFNELGSLITVTDIIGETITSDISDYGLAVQSKVKNATYEGDLVTGGTYFPSKSYGVTPRSSDSQFNDKTAEYFLDSGIRNIVIAEIQNLDVGTIVTADISEYVVSKEEWDDLEIETDASAPNYLLYNGKYKNNTFYFVEGDSIITNVGTHYLNSGAAVSGDDVMEQVIKTWLYNSATYSLSDYNAQNVRDMEMIFYYQAVRDMDIRVERHNIDRVSKNATLISNQKDSKLELQRYGKAMKSQINRVGNDSYEVMLRYNNLKSHILWEMNDYDSDIYKIIKIQYLIRENSMDIMYKFVKNSSILNPFTAVNRSVSPFTVTKRNVLSCFIYNEYLEFSGTNKTDVGLLTLNGRKALFNALKWNATYNTPIFSAQFISPSSSSVLLNMSATRTPMGQSLIFNAEFQEPKIAGYQLAEDTVYLAGALYSKKLTPVSYTDVYGQVSSFTMKWYNDLSGGVDTHPVGTVASGELIGSNTYSVGLNPNEALGLSFHIHCISDRENLIVGDYFTLNNSLMKILVSQSVTVACYPGTTKHTIYDKNAKTGSTHAGGYSIDANYKILTITGVNAGESWILCESASPSRIYLAYNYDGTDLNTIYINNLTDRPNIETL